MLSLEFWGAKKEPPEARKREFMLSLEFWAVKRALWGSPGGRKQHFYHVFKQVLQKAPNRGNRRKSHLPGKQRKQRLQRFRRNNARIRAATGGTNRGGPPPEETLTA
jgi:hypothetical protein